MNQLLSNVSTFLQATLQHYALPQDLTTDLHTLNAYLKKYTEADENALTHFVERFKHKIGSKTKTIRPFIANKTQQRQEDPVHPISDNACSIKYQDLRLDLRLDLPTQTSEVDLGFSQSFLNRSERPLSNRSTKSKENEGIRSARHKFGTRERNKTQRVVGKELNKENKQLNANIRLNNKTQKQLRCDDQTLKAIRSQAELMHKHNSQAALLRKASNEPFKPCIRYDSAENRLNSTNNSSLKIKLRPKTLLDVTKILEGVDLTLHQIEQDQRQIQALMRSIEEDEVFQ